MNFSKISALLSAITDIVKEDQPYREKVKEIKDACDGDDLANLEEFLAWFDEVEE